MRGSCIRLIPIILLATTAVFSQPYVIDRIEPPFWWVGMKSPHLQLMVYGENIAQLRPEVDSDKVILKEVHKGTSANYLFLDLEIARDADACSTVIHFYNEEEFVRSYIYHLFPREDREEYPSGFNASDVMYLITPDRFANGDTKNDEVEGLKDGLNRSAEYGRHGGDIQGIVDRLDYIRDMGFTAIWLNPVLENDMAQWSYHGYATTDYYKVDPRLGSNEEYRMFCAKAAQRDVGVIMDMIVNHCGSDHWWMADPPFTDWVNGQDEPYQETNHRKTTLLDPYVSQVDRDRMVQGWFVPSMPDLNQKNPFMAKYLIQNTIWWIEYAGISGIRQDTYSYSYRDFMSDWTCAIKEEYPEMSIVGEEWTENANIVAYWQRDKINPDGYTSCLNSQMDFPLNMALHKSLREEEGWGTGLIRLYDVLSKDFIYPHPEDLVIFPDNHDMSRIYTQLDEDIDLVKTALSFILTTRGIPQIYYGTEILMSNRGTDSHGIIRSDFPGGWEDDEKDAFIGLGLSEEERMMQDWCKKLINWRKSKSVIHTGKLKHYVPEDGVYVYFRYDSLESVMVVLNKNDSTRTLSLGRFSESLRGYTTAREVMNGKEYLLNESLMLEPKTSMILELK